MLLKKFTGVLLTSISTVLIIGFVQPVFSDHLLDESGIFLDENRINLISSKNSQYQIHLQVEVRNSQDQLITVSEHNVGQFIPHEITDVVFNREFAKKEIITIEGIKYEKAQFTRSITAVEVFNHMLNEAMFVGQWLFPICGEFVGHPYQCIPIFEVTGATVYLEDDDTVKQKWTVLREI